MNLELDVDFEGAEVGIERLTMDRIEFAFVVLFHQTRHKHLDVLALGVRYDDSGFDARRSEVILHRELCSQNSSGFGFDPERPIRIQKLALSSNDQRRACLFTEADGPRLSSFDFARTGALKC